MAARRKRLLGLAVCLFAPWACSPPLLFLVCSLYLAVGGGCCAAVDPPRMGRGCCGTVFFAPPCRGVGSVVGCLRSCGIVALLLALLLLEPVTPRTMAVATRAHPCSAGVWGPHQASFAVPPKRYSGRMAPLCVDTSEG